MTARRWAIAAAGMLVAGLVTGCVQVVNEVITTPPDALGAASDAVAFTLQAAIDGIAGQLPLATGEDLRAKITEVEAFGSNFSAIDRDLAEIPLGGSASYILEVVQDGTSATLQVLGTADVRVGMNGAYDQAAYSCVEVDVDLAADTVVSASGFDCPDRVEEYLPDAVEVPFDDLGVEIP